jgi:type I restriction enzyme S subunit
MRSNYRRIGDFIERTNTRNREGFYDELLGININKYFMPSVANVVGTDLTKYKIVEPKMFACNRMHVGRDMRLPIAFSDKVKPFLVSPAYDVFIINNPKELLHEYLMMWFTRAEFDRNTWFYTDTDVRGKLGWDSFCDMTLPVPTLKMQQEIVNDYNTVQDRIRINEELNTALEATAQALYKHWFVDFEFPSSHCQTEPVEVGVDIEKLDHSKGYKSSGGAIEYNEDLDMEIPVGWEVEPICKIADLKYGKMLDSMLFSNEGYPVFSGYGIRGYYSEYHYEKPMILVLCRGVSGTGKVRMSPAKAFITNLSIVVIEERELISKNYLYFYLKNDNLRRLDSGSAQSQITINDLEKAPVLIPDYDLVLDFADRIEVLNKQGVFFVEENDALLTTKITLLSKMATVVDDNDFS